MATKAQITKIDTYSNKIKDLSKADREAIDNLFFGPISRIQLNESRDPSVLWEEEGTVKGVELNSNLISQLKNISHSKPFATAQVLAIKWEKGKDLNIGEDNLMLFGKLKYILIKSYDPISIDELKTLLKDLISSEKISNDIEIVYFQMELPS